MPVIENDSPLRSKRPWANFDPNPPEDRKIIGTPHSNFIPDGGLPEYVPVPPNQVGKTRGVGKWSCVHCDESFETKQERAVHLEDCNARTQE